jgi:hypothetical protein
MDPGVRRGEVVDGNVVVQASANARVTISRTSLDKSGLAATRLTASRAALR